MVAPALPCRPSPRQLPWPEPLTPYLPREGFSATRTFAYLANEKPAVLAGLKLMAGAGFELAVPRMRDYELGPGNPVIVKSPEPPFCFLRRFSNFPALDRDIPQLTQTKDQGPFPLSILILPHVNLIASILHLKLPVTPFSQLHSLFPQQQKSRCKSYSGFGIGCGGGI